MSAEPALPAAPATFGRRARHYNAVGYIRGSSLLLVGRIVGQLTDTGALILLARYLSKAEYGAFGYALSIVVLFKAVALFELPNTLGRFVPLYREERRYDEVLGSIALGVGIVAGLGLLIALGIDGALGIFHLRPTASSQALTLVMILAFLIPVESLDVLLTNLFAVFAGPRAIFVRQAILGPGLKLGLVLTMIAVGADAVAVGSGYLAIGTVGLIAYSWMFKRMLGRELELAPLRRRRPSYPVREIVGFAAPLLMSTLVWLFMESSDAVLLGYFRDISDVASFRAVVPLAVLNKGVILTFGLLYTPVIARLFARRERAGIAEMYWQSALWVTLLTFPIFIVTFSFARSTTLGLFGARYDSSVTIMALLSFGYFFHTSLGFNGLTLRVFKKLRYTVGIDAAAAAANVCVNLLLIPRWGALGAAIGTSGTMVVHNVLKQLGLWRYTGITLFRRSYVRPYVSLFAVAFALLVAQRYLPASLPLAVAVAALAGAAAIWMNRGLLQVDAMFPELTRWPIVRSLARLSGGGRDSRSSRALPPLPRAVPLRRIARPGRRRPSLSRIVGDVLELTPPLRGDGRPADWRALSTVWTDTGVAVVTLGRAAGQPTAVLKLASTREGARSLGREAGAVAALTNDVRLAELSAILPEILAVGEVESWTYVVERALGGVNGQRLLRTAETATRVRAAAAATIGILHRRTAVPTAVDAPTLERWIGRPLAVLDASMAHRPGAARRTAALERLAAELESALRDRKLAAGWIHGDFWLGNVLASADGSRITGVVDWDEAEDGQSPLLDLLHLLLYTRRLVQRRQLGDVVRDLLRDMRWSEDEERLLAASDPELLDDPRRQRAMILLYWLRHGAANFAQSSAYARNWFWMTRNVDAVLRSL